MIIDFRNRDLEFKILMKERRSDELATWIELTIKSDINELAGFANGLKADYTAIENAFRLPWSNGAVEGNLNRLKTVKRQMYAHAGFDLLKRR